MTRAKRRRMSVMLVAGMVLTILVMCADSAGWLSGLEDWGYDTRAKYFQFFLKPPSDLVAHVDLDDNTLRTMGLVETIGSWPWPRKIVARLIEEILACGAKVIV